jgi:riboflavin kinase / FMN adenylyltransferase
VKIIRSLEESEKPIPSVCTVGSFDGLHRAHQAIIREVTERSRLHGMRSVVITFDPHPKEIVKTQTGPIELLTTLQERIDILERFEIDLLFIVPFTFEFSRLPARDFYRQYVVKGIDAKEVVVGYDHMFGRDRESGIKDILDFGTEFGFGVHTVPPFRVGETVVSSTKIRRLLYAGNVREAANLLGWSYSLSGTVIRGDERGRTLGFPTANIKPGHHRKLIPGNGVYFVTGKFDRRIIPGMLNIGVRPTFGENGRQSVELHFLDEVGDVYGKSLTVEFIDKIRDEKKFGSVDELINALEQDKQTCLRLASDIQSLINRY